MDYDENPLDEEEEVKGDGWAERKDEEKGGQEEEKGQKRQVEIEVERTKRCGVHMEVGGEWGGKGRGKGVEEKCKKGRGTERGDGGDGRREITWK